MKFTPFAILILLSFQLISAQDCRFEGMQMGEKFDKCSSVCQGRKYKCIGDETCLCQQCPNGNKGNSYVNTFEDADCEFTQECSRKCMEANAEPEHGGYIGRGKRCDFTDDFYGQRFSVCVCACL